MRALLAALVLLPCAAQAQQGWQPQPQMMQIPCGPWPQLAMDLKKKYNETIIGSGEINPQTVILVLSSPAGKTFTIVKLMRGGDACIIGDGKELDIGDLPAAGDPT